MNLIDLQLFVWNELVRGKEGERERVKERQEGEGERETERERDRRERERERKTERGSKRVVRNRREKKS